jgi:putative IMPACT (imprinted ancient) family translation regulator
MTQRICSFLFLSISLLTLSSFAQEDNYKESLSAIIEEAKTVEDFLNTNSVDYSDYDKWYKEFKKLSEVFLKDFSKTHKYKSSFKAIGEGIEALSLVWADLNQSEYAQEQYREYITSEKVEDAHRWKSRAIELRKKATEEISRALENFQSAEDYLKKE